jgi:CrcB protein
LFGWKQFLLVLAGGGIGSLARYVLTTLIADKYGAHFPFGTLFVNVVGCFIIGFFMIWTTERTIVSPNLRILVTVGFLGGLTTFSSFGFETIQLLRAGNVVNAFLNMAANLGTGFLAVWLGIIAAKWI